MTDREALRTVVVTCPEDTTARLVYADYLDENDEPEEAARQRRVAEGYRVVLELETHPEHVTRGMYPFNDNDRPECPYEHPATQKALGAHESYCWWCQDRARYTARYTLPAWWFDLLISDYQYLDKSKEYFTLDEAIEAAADAYARRPVVTPYDQEQETRR